MTDLPIAGELYAFTYRTRIDGVLTDLPAAGGVDQVVLKQAGVTISTIAGPAVHTATGTYLFPAATMPDAGDYDAEITYRTAATPDKLDIGETLKVYAFAGDLGDSGLVTLAQAKTHLDITDTENDDELQFFVSTANEWIATKCGTSTAYPVRMGTLELVRHLWESQRGPGFASLDDDSDGSFSLGLLGFAIPTRVLELIAPFMTALTPAPLMSFPVAADWPT